MKLFCVLVSLLAVGNCYSSLNLCDDNDPRCACQRAGKSLGILRPVGDASSDNICYCSCDRCSNHPCPEFTICKLNTTGYPFCEASVFTCTREVNVQVCAFDHLVDEIKYFTNMCYLVNEIFERRSVENGNSLERRDCQTMAVIHSH